jgi:2-polyprenyl-3-methyl-5-hydroxy-6-metoxy-1,4-benzoquinol methylase
MNKLVASLTHGLRRFGMASQIEKGQAAESIPHLERNAEEEKVIQASPYTAPLWLIAPPERDDVPWQWSVPTLTAPVSQMCTSEQMEGPLYDTLCREVGIPPSDHRKTWELIFILSAFHRHGVLVPGARVLGFGVGKEPLPSAFAGKGLHVTATDAPPEIIEGMGWQSTDQHLSAIEDIWREHTVSREEFDRLVRFEPVDMNAIPDHLTGYDGCWSACALEHLGSIEHGLDFIENSLRTLRPGGVAVHTTEFNLSSNDETFDAYNLALFRRQDIERLAARLTAAGHDVAPLNFYPGGRELDQHIDLPPYAMPHLKLEVGGFTCTSFGIVVRKRTD